MISLVLSDDYAYVIACAIAFYVQQQFIFVIPVAMKRKKYGVKTPTLYPRDSEIKALKMSDDDVHDYMCTQRAHQNNVEFTSVFMPIFLLAGAVDGQAKNVFYAGLVIFLNRLLGGLGYAKGLRKYSSLWHLGEFYVLYILGREAYRVLSN